MRLLAGTSGFAYSEWRGAFYPQDLPAAQMLRWYAERFDAVEINNTFYRIPRAQLLARWRETVPDGFTFVLKASQSITHFRRLHNTTEPVGWFFDNARVLADHLGPVLVQLAPNFSKDLARLEEFLRVVPAEARFAFDFRHASWLDDDVYERLRACGAALCCVDGEELDAPLIATAGWGYLRLRRAAYTNRALDAWIERVRTQNWGEVFVFFRHEDRGTAPRLAARLMERFAR